MIKFTGNDLFLIFMFVFIICCIVKITSMLKKITKTRLKSHGKPTNETPVSLLEITVARPARVIFGDEAIVEKYDPSELAQLRKLRLGEGTLGTLYKVVHSGGCTVAILKYARRWLVLMILSFGSSFLEDWAAMLHSSHCSLGGFWYGGEAFVLHEYFCLGSLEELLHGTEGIQFTPLTWTIRQQIALSAAKAVAAIRSQVIENGKALVCRVIKASNSLIRIDFSTCLSSYETPYLVPPATIIRRNLGRVEPELNNQNRPKVFTQMSDVYSFGILLLELVTGRKASVTNFGEYIKEKKRREGLIGVPDKRMVDVDENFVSVIGTARLYLQNDPKRALPWTEWCK